MVSAEIYILEMNSKTSPPRRPEESGKFYGYASVFNVEDSQGDIVLSGAFSKTLKASRDIRLLFQHSQTDELGKITLLREDAVGLYVEGRISTEGRLGRSVYSYAKSNLLNGLSIGYSVENSYFDGRGRRVIRSLNLLEISLVSFPANRFSRIIHCKSRSGPNG
ncbi:MAG: HK97 family phage prohead protease [Rickettsiales bacterium]|nr:HK97 family phage prohead protease [Rickettsiales bacterium]